MTDRRARNGEHLPPFSLYASCPKCGHGDVAVHYRRASCNDADCDRPGCDQEHLLRVCQRCRYDWPEAVIESGDTPAVVPQSFLDEVNSWRGKDAAEHTINWDATPTERSDG